MDHSRLSTAASDSPETIAMEAIKNDLLRDYGLSWEDIVHKTRKPHIVFVRHLLAFLIRRKTRLSIHKIGQIMNRTHPDISRAIQAIENYITTDSLGKRAEILIYMDKYSICK